MNTTHLLGFLLLLALWLPAQGQTLIAQFSSANYEGWTYENNAGTELSTLNINSARITLLTTTQGTVTALVSPTLACQNYDSLRVELTYRAFSTDYDASLMTVNAQLADLQGNPLALATMKPAPGLMMQTLTTTLAVPHGTTDALMRFTAPRANVNNCAAVTRVRIYGNTNINGDVNGDGVADIDDLNIVINIILHKDQAEKYGLRANVDGQGSVDIEDVNAIINIILHKQ